MEHDLNRYSELALRLRESPEVIRTLIREPNWRPTLLGNALTILLRDPQFQNDLVWRLVNWTWVAPQVAVGIALVSDAALIPELEILLANTSGKSHPKTILSAYFALKLRGSEKAKQFETSLLYNELKAEDRDNCIEIAERHWNFWKNIKPVTT